MSLFKSKDIECTCWMCGAVWYTTKKEIRDSRQHKEDIKAAELSTIFPFTKSYRRNVTRLAMLRSSYVDPLRCPKCGSTNVNYR